MVKKAIDFRIPALIRNGAQEKKRSFFVVVGDRQKDVVVNLYHILLNVDIKLNKSVLWAYKNKLLGFTSHRRKREKKIKKEIKRGIRDADSEDPFDLFVSTQDIRYVYYKETDKILGNTFGMCILQDFEAITPNLLARTIETVEGGGLIILLLKGMNSLKQLYTLSMDIHARYRTEAHADVVARFNERFILSLGECSSCLVITDEMDVIPISGASGVKQLPPPNPDDTARLGSHVELQKVKDSLADSEPVGSLVKLAKTTDQAKALLTFVDAIAEKTLQSTVALTAARGRGKSAALGVAIAAAVAHGYSNIFITSPSPENLKTLFDFLFKGFDALNYLDHVDYTIIQSTNPDFSKAIVRVNVHRQHRQTIQYIQPKDAYTLGQAELLVIDEAAAIPLPLIRKLMGPYLVFMASTINGYEGTGRSLSLKLISQLREQSRGRGVVNDVSNGADKNGISSTTSRTLREITLAEPIRYAAGDAVEKWLNGLLCLDATLPKRSSLLATGGVPEPSQCQLLAVNRDSLFSFHGRFAGLPETFLHSMISLYVASHYKNSPNDLQLMSDAPAHYLYVLVPPTTPGSNPPLPEPLCVIQVALEGQISKESVQHSLSRGQRAGGDLIPWLVSQQFQDDEFAGLSGARIVRIATNPEYAGMGYGRRALSLLIDFYSGRSINLSESDGIHDEAEIVRVTDEELENAVLSKDNPQPRAPSSMPPLFSRMSEIQPPAALDYIGVSYGLTQDLHKFWKREKFVPVYLRQTPNDLTGEYTCVMLRTISHDGNLDAEQRGTWLAAYAQDFHRRFLSLLSYNFRTFPCVLALSIDESASAASRHAQDSSTSQQLSKADIDTLFTPHDLRRLDSYAANMLDYHVILDVLPRIAMLYFAGPLRHAVQLTYVQQAILLAIGCQHHDVEEVAKELNLNGTGQLLAMFVKLVRKIANCFRALLEGAVAADMPGEDAGRIEDGDDDEVNGATDETATQGHLKRFQPLTETVEEDLAEGVNEIKRAEKERLRSMIDALPLDRYEIEEGAGWEDAERQVERAAKRSGGGASNTVSVKKSGAHASKRKGGEALQEAWKEAEGLQNGNGMKRKKSNR